MIESFCSLQYFLVYFSFLSNAILGYASDMFSWESYLQTSGSVAPRLLFTVCSKEVRTCTSFFHRLNTWESKNYI